MKKTTKILIAVGAVVLAAAVIAGILFAVSSRKVPELDKEKTNENPVFYNTVYVVGQPPYSDELVFDTQMGMNNYWSATHSGGNGVEVVLQQSKDGELIMLSEALPAMSDADDLYGEDVKVSDLTLEELRRINLYYDCTDEDGFRTYVGLTDERLARVSVVTLDEMLEFFGSPGRVTVRLFVRFYDEAQIADVGAALETVYNGLKAHALESNAVFLPQSDEAAAAADTACPDLVRAATNAEAKALYRDSSRNKTQESLPYSVIYEKCNGQFGSEKFIHYARNLGLVVVLSDVPEDDVLKVRGYGVSAIATSDAEPIIQILKDAKKADREAKKAADSSAQQ